jgi:hypothetical protein
VLQVIDGFIRAVGIDVLAGITGFPMPSFETLDLGYLTKKDTIDLIVIVWMVLIV